MKAERFYQCITAILTFTFCAQGTDVVFVNEGFEDGILPSGWTKSSQGEGWIIGTTSAVSVSGFAVPSRTGNIIAARDSTTNNNGLYDYLITPKLNFTTSDQYFLQFDSYYNGNFGQTATVQVSQNATAFITILQVQPSDTWQTIQLNVGRWVHCETVQIRFWSSDEGYTSGGSTGSGWAIDNVLIVGKDVVSAPNCPEFLFPSSSVLLPGSPIIWNQSTDATEFVVTYGSWNPYQIYDNEVNIGYSSFFIPQKHQPGVNYFFKLVASNKHGLSSPCALNFTSLPGNNLTLPYSETFSNSVFPDLWTQDTFDYGDWTVSNQTWAYGTVSITDQTGDNGYFLLRDDVGNSPSDVLLPPFDWTAHTNVSISFFAWLAFAYTALPGYIHVDVWFNDTWCFDVVSPITVNGTVPIPSPAWQQQVIDMTPFISNFTVIRIRGQTADSSLAPLAVDDFLIQGDVPFTASPPNLSNCVALPATSSYIESPFCSVQTTDGSTTTSSDVQSGSSDKNAVIIGATVGSISGLLIVSALIGTYLVLRSRRITQRKREFQQQMSMQPVERESSFGSNASDGNTQYLSYNRESWAVHASGNKSDTNTSLSLPSSTSIGGTTREYSSWENSTIFPVLDQGISRSWVIDYKELDMQKELGFGSFGVVFKALWRKSEVAVKKLKANDFNEKKLTDFLTEADLLMKLRPHTNVVQFQGVCLQPLCLIYEFLPMGNLYQFVRTNEMDLPFQVKILRGTAAGMLHLHSEKIVHRDLAARNILISGDLIPKVSDFGMSRLLEAESSGMQTQTTTGPLKWMAPESLTHRIYSNKTDVWSYGVLLYEVFLKQDPYPHLDPVQSATQLILGQVSLLTDFPSNTHPQILSLATACLQIDSQKRPDFDQICELLDSLLEVLSNEN